MKKDKIIEYSFAIGLCIVLFFNLFVLNVFTNKIIFSSFLLVYVVLCKIFIKSPKVENVNRRKVIISMCLFAIIYVGILYILGIFAGFYRNPIRPTMKEMYNRILPISAIIIISEYIRHVFVTKNDKKSTIVITIALVLIDVLTYINLYNYFDLDEVLALVGYVGLSSVSLNLLNNYIVRRYSNAPNIIYRIITSIYIYIFSILPDVYLFFQSVYRIIFPYAIYLVLEYTFTTNDFKLALKNRKTNLIGFIITAIISIIIVLLISCQFKYGVMVVGSSSMSQSIDKGDVVFFERFDNQTLKEGQVIIFNKDGIQTIHRIKEVRVLNGETIYYTKGDNNQQEDDGYRTSGDIQGIVKFKIIKIGWPTLLVNEVFKK